jgi:membrane associated rhomboid family serine protease
MLNPVFVIIAINLGIFIAVQISPVTPNGVHQLAIDLSLYSDIDFFLERPWGIITGMFVHDGYYHLFANMITLYFFGGFFNRLVGSRTFLLVYFGGGIAGGIFFILLASNALAIGASGAVFALGAAMAMIMPRMKVIIFPIPAPIQLWMATIGIFVILTLLPMMNVLSNIAWQAHLGGALVGLIAGYILKRRKHFYV